MDDPLLRGFMHYMEVLKAGESVEQVLLTRDGKQICPRSFSKFAEMPSAIGNNCGTAKPCYQCGHEAAAIAGAEIADALSALAF